MPSLVWRVGRRAVPRAYALLLILLIGWLTVRSVQYLVTSLFRPAAAPAQITELPLRLNEAFLKTERSAWRAVDAAENPRTTPAHYHRIDTWVHPDPYNDCARSGCHGALPHSKRKETRAFLNMHATSLHCGVCHLQSHEKPVSLTWYDLDDGKRRNPPVLLEAYGYLTSKDNAPRLKAPNETVKRRIVDLLLAAAEEADQLPSLTKLAGHFKRVRPGSEAFDKLVQSARESLPRHFRGEYGAKLALSNPASGTPLLGHPETEAAISEFQNRADSTTGQQLAALIEEVHPLRRKEPLKCLDCHRPDGGVIDFARAGYPAARVESLVHPIVARMIEHLDAGTPFRMPDFIAPSANSATDMP